MRASKSECCRGGVAYCSPAIAAFCRRFMLLNVVSSAQQRGMAAALAAVAATHASCSRLYCCKATVSSFRCASMRILQTGIHCHGMALHACGKHTLVMPS
jgi:hypothetical protein